MRDRGEDRPGHGRHNRSGEWLGSNTQPTQNPAYLGGKRDRQRGDVQSRRRGIEDSVSAVTGSQDNEHTAEIGRLRMTGGEHIPNSQPPRQTHSTQNDVPPEPPVQSAEAPRTQPSRGRANEGGAERPD